MQLKLSQGIAKKNSKLKRVTKTILRNDEGIDNKLFNTPNNGFRKSREQVCQTLCSFKRGVYLKVALGGGLSSVIHLAKI